MHCWCMERAVTGRLWQEVIADLDEHRVRAVQLPLTSFSETSSP